MAVTSIGGVSAAGSVPQVTIGNVLTLDDGQRFDLRQIDLGATVATNAVLQQSTDGGATFVDVKFFVLASAGQLGRRYDEDSPGHVAVGDADGNIQLRAQFVQAGGAGKAEVSFIGTLR